METSPSLPSMIFSVKINCCKSCPERVRKSVLMIEGVESVRVETEKKLVSVVGKVDHEKVLKTIQKLGKKPQLLSYDDKKQPPGDNAAAAASETSLDNNYIVKENRRLQSGLRNRIFSSNRSKNDHSSDDQVLDERCLCPDHFCQSHTSFPSAYALSSTQHYGGDGQPLNQPGVAQ